MNVHPIFTSVCSDKPANLRSVLRNIDSNISDDEGRSPICYMTNPKCVRMLIEVGFDVNKKDNNGETPIFNAKSFSIMKMLYERGALLSVVNKKGESLLHKIDNEEALEFFIEKGIDVNIRDLNGRTALFNRTFSVTKILRDHIDLNIRDNEMKTAIFYTDNISTMALLSKSDMTLQDKLGKPYPFTVMSNREIMDFLINNVDLTLCTDSNLNSLLHLCSDIELYGKLMKKLDITKWNRNRETLLHITEDTEIARLLLNDERCNFMDIKDVNGNTKLHTTKNIDIVRMLIDKGARLDRKNKDGKYPSDLQTGEIKKLIDENIDHVKLNIKKSGSLIASFFKKK